MIIYNTSKVTFSKNNTKGYKNIKKVNSKSSVKQGGRIKRAQKKKITKNNKKFLQALGLKVV